MFPKAVCCVCFKVRITSTVCFDLSVRECLYSMMNVMMVGMLEEILYAAASVSVCALGLEK